MSSDSWIVLKFGGTSINYENFEVIKNIINKYQSEYKNIKILIVLSAIRGVTDKLVDFTKFNKINETKNIIKYIEEKYFTIYNKINNNTINNFIFEKEFNKFKNYILDYENSEDIDINPKIISYGEYLSTFILNDYLKFNNIKSHILDSKNIIKSECNNKEIFDKYIFTKNTTCTRRYGPCCNLK